jgi:GTPase Era involved in 16S rRNA processing
MITKSQWAAMPQEEKDKIMTNVRISIIGLHATLNAAKHYKDFIKEYEVGISNKRTVKVLKDGFISLEYLLSFIDSAFKVSKEVKKEDMDAEEEFTYKILENLEDECFQFVNHEMGFNMIRKALG